MIWKTMIAALAMTCLLTGCGGTTTVKNTETVTTESTENKNAGTIEIELQESEAMTAAEQNSYQQIDQETAKKMMDEQDVLILDVREQDEYDSGHIKDAVLLPVGTINEETAAAVIPAKDTTVLVYCRSGNRSKTASAALVELGYTQIYEFGGIKTWQYETEME